MDGGGPEPTKDNPYATEDYWKDRTVAEGPDDEAAEAARLVKEEAEFVASIPIMQFITTARILDTLYALLEVQSPAKHLDLLEAHSKGLLLGPSPAYTGRFMTDEANV